MVDLLELLEILQLLLSPLVDILADHVGDDLEADLWALFFQSGTLARAVDAYTYFMVRKSGLFLLW